MTQLRDNILKGMVLNAIGNDCSTFNEIRNHIATTTYEFHYDGIDDFEDLYTYQNYDGLKSALNYYRHQKFISIIGGEKKRPRCYELTSLGYRHAHDPLIRRNYRKARTEEEANKIAESILMNDERFRQAVQEQVVKYKSQKVHTTVEKPGVKPVDNIITVQLEDGTEKEIEFEGNEIRAVTGLKEIAEEQSTRLIEYENLIRYYQRKEEAENAIDVKKLNREITRQETITYRKEIAGYYFERQYLDHYFFMQWGNAVPVTIKRVWDWRAPFRKGSVEIMSKNNREFKRGHVDEIMDAELIVAAQFYIHRILNKGIEIFGNGMTDVHFMNW